MFHRYLKLFKQNGSHYVSWNILLLCGFGLWIALCTSNMFQSENLQTEAALFYLQNSTFGIAYNVSIKTETMEDMLRITTTNYAMRNLIIIFKSALQYIRLIVSTSFILLFVSLYEYLRKVVKIWNNVLCNFCTVVPCSTTFARDPTKDDHPNNFNKEINENDYTILKSELIANSIIDMKHLEVKLNRDDKEYSDYWALKTDKSINITFNADINKIVQSEIVFSNYTLLLFNNYDLYQCFNNQLPKNYLLNKHFMRCSSQYKLKASSNYRRNENLLSRKIIQRGIVSSSPEFQRFLANLKNSRLLYPCMLEVSTSYSIRIRSIYK